MDSRDYLDPDGWPVIADRDRLPIASLLQGGALTASFVKRENAVRFEAGRSALLTAIAADRDGVAYELTFPSWWHFAPVRAFRCCDKPKPPPKPTKPLYIWLRRG